MFDILTYLGSALDEMWECRVGPNLCFLQSPCKFCKCMELYLTYIKKIGSTGMSRFMLLGCRVSHRSWLVGVMSHDCCTS
jgi:hypothetical protein